MKKLLSVFVLAAIGTVIWAWFYISNATSSAVVPTTLPDYAFTIEDGASIDSILGDLEEKGVSINPWVAKIYFYQNPQVAANIQAGSYRLIVGHTFSELFESFQDAESTQQVLTFLEGWRREEFAKYLVAETSEAFAQEWFELSEGYEGRLFPDTYFIDEQTTPNQLLKKILANYDLKIGFYADREDLLPEGLSFEDVLVFASMVEREVNNPVDQALVAGILMKRYLSGWKIDVDATVQYVVVERNLADYRSTWQAIVDEDFDWWPRELTFDELEIDSPYNTRLNADLPPMPISNPGRSSVEAVLNPFDSEYWFYITDQDGVTRYATTLVEHNQNIATFGVSQ